MTAEDIIGLPLSQALQSVKTGYQPILVFADSPNQKRDLTGLTPRVVRVIADTWLVSHFKDNPPKE